MNIGFIGLGVMGRPMAGLLLEAGHRIFSCINVSEVDPDLLAAGLQVLEHPAEVAAHAEIIITMLPDTTDVERVLLADDGVLAGIRPGSLVIDMSSISPQATRRFAHRTFEKACEYLDAPVSGGQAGAEQGSLSIMVGGDEASFERAMPLFRILGKNITRVGDIGSGQICKIANQIIVGLNIEAVAEALVFAARAGAEPARVREALMGGFASSKVLETHGEKMIMRRFEPGFRVDLHRKDLNLALEAARELGIALPNTASTLQLFNALAAEPDGGQRDHAALVQVIERLAAIRLGD
jgi:2-hydroxy-3-oxopropionate reductase